MNDWYGAWAARHATVFGLNDDRDLATMLSWEATIGATEAELHAATTALASDPQRFARSEARFSGKLTLHLAVIKEAVAEVRKRKAEAEERRRQEAEYRSARVDPAEQQRQRDVIQRLLRGVDRGFRPRE